MTSRPVLLSIGIAAAWLAVLGSAAGAVYMKHRSRDLFVELEKLNQRRDALEVEWGQLQLEQSAWSTHAFVERVASERLRMATPRAQDIQVVGP
jgi:cell division protein FtsL